MNKLRFIEERRQVWKRFEELLVKAESFRKSRLTGVEISELSRLFRSISHDLATVRSRDWGRELESELNALVLRGYNRFYQPPPGRLRGVLHFLTSGFPQLLRANAAYFWVALALFVLPGLVAGWVVGQDLSLANRILPASQLAQFDSMYAESVEDRGTGGGEAFMTGFYVYNNVGIAFQCFATGLFFGIGTIFFLVYNSIVLATVGVYVVSIGHSERFLSFVISHGSFELTAIVISGAAGLILGHSIVHPGALSRLESLRVRGMDAVRLAAGAGVMLGVAALIEAYWSPSAMIPVMAKYIVGSILWIVVALYLGLSGRVRT